MALRAVFHRNAGREIASLFSFTRSAHALALPAPSDQAIESPTAPLLSLPEHVFISESSIGFQFPDFVSGGGSMELMAVPKRKTSPHKRGIRNGPKALKPIPVIIRCLNCGRIKLPHFYCCGGRREGTVENSFLVVTNGRLRLSRLIAVASLTPKNTSRPLAVASELKRRLRNQDPSSRRG
ncbi:hypothetical protein V2J09_015348 [Rumex salicifolius]